MDLNYWTHVPYSAYRASGNFALAASSGIVKTPESKHHLSELQGEVWHFKMVPMNKTTTSF